mmetsp:Transcript_37405/g.67278  ORF Transcript_37405/g.67278 Transcript_37405/m.67278 type:complete len:223 (+) Transcript_37405:9-677(+)
MKHRSKGGWSSLLNNDRHYTLHETSKLGRSPPLLLHLSLNLRRNRLNNLPRPDQHRRPRHFLRTLQSIPFLSDIPRNRLFVLFPRAVGVGNFGELEFGCFLETSFVDDDGGDAIVFAFGYIIGLFGGWCAEFGREFALFLPGGRGSCTCPASPAGYNFIFLLFTGRIVSFFHLFLFLLKLLFRRHQVRRRRKCTSDKLGLAKVGNSNFLLCGHWRRRSGSLI